MGDIGKPRRRVIQVPATPIRRPVKEPSRPAPTPAPEPVREPARTGSLNPSSYIIPLSATTPRHRRSSPG